MSSNASRSLDSLQWISQEYFDMNGTHYEVLDTPPTALEFSRIAHISRPVLVKGFEVPATMDHWTDQYLIESMGRREIAVAVTPNGRADAVTTGPDGRRYFAEPHIATMPFSDFMNKISHPNHSNAENIHYLQSQNGNMYTGTFFSEGPDSSPSEFDPLRKDVPSDVPWCTDAFDKTPDAVNIWIGNGQSVTSIHSDPYENIYTVVRGAKHFLLFPPTDGWLLEERTFPRAIYKPASAGSHELHLVPSSSNTPAVRWSSVTDPRQIRDAHPLSITVHAGETLYLPAGWWHQVEQSQQELTIALNWWYDIEVQGTHWVWLSFLRGAKDVPPFEAAVTIAP